MRRTQFVLLVRIFLDTYRRNNHCISTRKAFEGRGRRGWSSSPGPGIQIWKLGRPLTGEADQYICPPLNLRLDSSPEPQGKKWTRETERKGTTRT